MWDSLRLVPNQHYVLCIVAVKRQWLGGEKEEHEEIMSQRANKKKYASRLQEFVFTQQCVH